MTGSISWDRARYPARNVLETVGQTPMVCLQRVVPGTGVEILVKMEYFGPSGSVKDRILPYMVEKAEKCGELTPGMSIIEGTTGNTGIATAMVGAVKGYPVLIVMPEGMSRERQQAIRAYGAELLLTPGAESDVDLVLEKVAELKTRYPGRYWEVGQFTRRDNVQAHYSTTGPEIWEQVGSSLQALVASQGSGGTLSGVGRYLKEQNPGLWLFAAEPEECAVLSGQSWGTHGIEGIGDGFVPDNLDLELLDGVVQVSTREALEMSRRLAREEGIFCGISSGCNVVAALKLARVMPEVKRIVTMINDNGLRYLSTELMDSSRKPGPSRRPEPPREDGVSPAGIERLRVIT